MDEIFSFASLCYLTNRYDEGFQLIYSSLISSKENVKFTDKDEQIFCLLSINLLEKRYKSFVKLHRLYLENHPWKIHQLIEKYLQEIWNELNLFSKKIHFLNEKFFQSNSINDRIHQILNNHQIK